MKKAKLKLSYKSIWGENIYAGRIIIAISVVIGFIMEYIGIPETNIAILFILGVVFISLLTKGYATSLLYSLAATLCFNYFFTTPYMAFEIDNASYVITFTIMMIVSVIISILTRRIKQNAKEANNRAEETQMLYVLANKLSAADNTEDVVKIAGYSLGEYIGADITIYYLDNPINENTYNLVQYSAANNSVEIGARQHTKNFNEVMDKCKADRSVKQYHITDNEQLIAFLNIDENRYNFLDANHKRVIGTMMENVSMAISRLRANEKQVFLMQENERERYRSNFLRSISHDLRTPLSGIMGTSEMIMDMTKDNEECHRLAKEISQDADWLHSIMENILNLTKLENRPDFIKKQPEAVEEIVGAVLETFERRNPDRELVVNIPDELMLVPMDAKLIAQTISNLIGNALKHTTPQQEIALIVEKDGDNACFTVADRGTGIPEEDLPNIFEMFYTISNGRVDAQKGIGLGLAICETVVKAHGGSISAANREGGGAKFTFTLPMGEYKYE